MYLDVDLSLAGNNKKIHSMLQPIIMYNGLQKPITPYTVKGFIWYPPDGFDDFLIGNLKNVQGLPVVPFRTQPEKR